MANAWTPEEQTEHVSKISVLLKSKDEDQEQACSFIASFTDNESFMDQMRSVVLEMFGDGTMWFKGDKGSLLKTADLSLSMGQHSTLFLRLVKNDLITTQNLDSLTLSDVTGRLLGDACANLPHLTSLTVQCSPRWGGKSVQMSVLPKELALCTELQVLTIGRYQNLVADTFDAPLSIRKLISKGATDGLLHGLLPWMPNVEEIVLTPDWSCSSITSIPDTIAQCSKLKVLVCPRHWSLKSVSGKIGECLEMLNLNVASTSVESLPHTLSSLSKLEFLDIQNTSIRYIPASLLSLPELQRINAKGCTGLIIQTNDLFQQKLLWKKEITCYPNDSRHRSAFVKQEYFDLQ